MWRFDLRTWTLCHNLSYVTVVDITLNTRNDQYKQVWPGGYTCHCSCHRLLMRSVYIGQMLMWTFSLLCVDTMSQSAKRYSGGHHIIIQQKSIKFNHSGQTNHFFTSLSRVLAQCIMPGDNMLAQFPLLAWSFSTLAYSSMLFILYLAISVRQQPHQCVLVSQQQVVAMESSSVHNKDFIMLQFPPIASQPRQSSNIITAYLAVE